MSHPWFSGAEVGPEGLPGATELGSDRGWPSPDLACYATLGCQAGAAARLGAKQGQMPRDRRSSSLASRDRSQRSQALTWPVPTVWRPRSPWKTRWLCLPVPKASDDEFKTNSPHLMGEEGEAGSKEPAPCHVTRARHGLSQIWSSRTDVLAQPLLPRPQTAAPPLQSPPSLLSEAGGGAGLGAPRPLSRGDSLPPRSEARSPSGFPGDSRRRRAGRREQCLLSAAGSLLRNPAVGRKEAEGRGVGRDAPASGPPSASALP